MLVGLVVGLLVDGFTASTQAADGDKVAARAHYETGTRLFVTDLCITGITFAK